MSVEQFIFLATAVVGAIIVAAELAIFKVVTWIVKAIVRKVRDKKRITRKGGKAWRTKKKEGRR